VRGAQVQAATPQNRLDLEINLDLPASKGLDLADILFAKGPAAKDASASEEEWEFVDTGLPVSSQKVSSSHPLGI
jgi:hypothetical protein